MQKIPRTEYSLLKILTNKQCEGTNNSSAEFFVELFIGYGADSHRLTTHQFRQQLIHEFLPQRTLGRWG